jgi:hypothetical protein
MALNASGPISLAGATAGESIALELGQSTTGQISLNDTAVRNLAGVPSGAITMPTNFWGKSNENYWMGTLSGTSTNGWSSGVDSSGNFYLGGYVNTYWNRGLSAKYDITGTIQYQNSIGLDGIIGYSPNIYADSSGNTYLVGNNQYGGQVTKVNSSGTIQWSKYVSNGKNVQFGGVTTDSSGYVYAVGSGYGLIVDNGYPGLYVVKFDSSGNIQWQRVIYQAGTQLSANGVAIDPSGNVFVVGRDTSVGSFVCKYDSSGNLQWQKNCGGGYTRGIVADSSYAYFNGGYFTGSNEMLFMSVDSATGTLFGNKLVGRGTYTSDVYSGNGNSIARDSSGNIYVCGYFNGYQPGYTNSVGIIVKFAYYGAVIWKRDLLNYDSSKDIQLNAISVRGDSLYINGKIGSADLFLKVPSDGSKTGYYVVGGNGLYYQSSNRVEAGLYNPTSTTSYTTGTPSEGINDTGFTTAGLGNTSSVTII